MKARVKATGEIVEVKLKHFSDFVVYVDENGVMYKGLYDLDFDLEENYRDSQIIPLPYEPDYWGKLHHQAAIDFIKSFLNNYDGSVEVEILLSNAIKLADVLVKKLKNEK